MNKIKRVLSVLIAGCTISACNSTPEKPMLANECEEPRPQICTMIYMPVCGLNDKGEFNTYSSGCNACSHPEVVGYNNHACEDSAPKNRLDNKPAVKKEY